MSIIVNGKRLSLEKYKQALGNGVEIDMEDTDILKPIYNPSTAKTDTGKDKLDLLPYVGLASTAKAFEYGLEQYGHENYRTAASYRPFLAASLRHINKLLTGEELDKDSNLNHISHALACLMMAEQIKADGKPLNDPNTMKSTGKRNS